MKLSQLLSCLALSASVALVSPALRAETTEETTTTTTTSDSGTISSFEPGTIIIRNQTHSTPTTYVSTRTTTYVDENGQPVAVETVKSGTPVTVYYSKSADGLEASKVVVRKTTTGDPMNPTTTTIEKKTTTVTP